MESKNFVTPDEVRNFEKGKVELVNLQGKLIGKAKFEPGWQWSKHVKPIAKTKSCQSAHFGYQITGIMHVVLDDGTEKEVRAGDVFSIPPGHDAWVVGTEPVVAVDFQGLVDYAKPR